MTSFTRVLGRAVIFAMLDYSRVSSFEKTAHELSDVISSLRAKVALNWLPRVSKSLFGITSHNESSRDSAPAKCSELKITGILDQPAKSLVPASKGTICSQALDQDSDQRVIDLLEAPPAENKYAALKQRL